MRFWSDLPTEMYGSYVLFLVNLTIVIRSLWILFRTKTIREHPFTALNDDHKTKKNM